MWDQVTRCCIDTSASVSAKERQADRSHGRSNVRRVALVLDLDDVERRLDAGDSPQAIASDLGVTDRTIRNHLHAAGRPLEKERRQQQQRDRLGEPVWLGDQYVEQSRSPSGMSRQSRTTC
jgi:GAF domain-containing protein